MSTWDIYDQDGNWLGTATGFTETEAIERAKLNGMANAASAELCESD